MNCDFGSVLRERRRAARLSQRELARQIGVDFSYISKIENGRLPPPAADTIVDICRVLETEPEELLALVTDDPLDIAVPQFSPDDIGPLVDLMEQQLAEWHGVDEVLLRINDTPVYLDPYVKKHMHKTLMEMVSALTCVEEVSSLSISLRRGQS